MTYIGIPILTFFLTSILTYFLVFWHSLWRLRAGSARWDQAELKLTMNRGHNPKDGCLIVALPTLNQVKLTPPAWTGQRTWPVHFLDVPKGHQLQATQKSHQGLYNLTMLDTPCYIRIETIHGTLLCFPQQVARATHTHKHTQIQKHTHTMAWRQDKHP